jgi:hypothetical protein
MRTDNRTLALRPLQGSKHADYLYRFQVSGVRFQCLTSPFPREKLRQNGIVSFSIRLTGFWASSGADTRHLNTSVQLSIFTLPGPLWQNFGHDHSKVGTLPRAGIHRNRPPVLLDNISGDYQTKPGAFFPF